jgi:hypothetical protein
MTLPIAIGVAMVIYGFYGALGRRAPKVAMTWQHTMNKIFTLGKQKSDRWERGRNPARFVRIAGWGMVIIGVVAIVIGLTQY